jgi:serine/threonine-protein kinase
MEQRDLFLSHSSGDAEVARELRSELEAAGYSCWMAPDDVDGTDPWAEQILAAIEACSAMLVLISGNANRSPHVSREVNLALGRRRPVLPIRIEDVPPEASLEYLLSLVQRIDAFPPPIASHAPRILRRLDSILRRGGKGISDSIVAAPPPPIQLPVDAPTDVDTRGAPSDTAVPIMDAEAETTEEPPTTPITTTVPATPGPGVTIGAFTIESVLGEGGMATVYRATQQEPRRSVALKVIRADHAADPVYRQRFLAEKDTLAALEHPSIVPIYAAGEADGVLYIAMRLVDGPDLAGRIEAAGRLSLADTIATIRPIADAVDYAHEMGVVHRDLKPSNIILDKRGRPYLTDFGLGKHVAASQGLSAPGIALGTLAYMAPEQFSGTATESLAGRIDIYALACVVYSCLTGAPPFDGPSLERVMYAHLHEQLPPRPDIPDAVEEVLRRALAKSPTDRYASAAEFIRALTAAASAIAVPTAAVPVRAKDGAGLSAWARANGMLVSAGATLAALIIVGTTALALTSNDQKIGAATDVPSARPTVPPVPSPSPGFTPTESPGQPTDGPTNPPPTPSTTPPQPTDEPNPGPTPDLKAPTRIGVAVKGSAITTSRKVSLSLQASGASQMRLGTATTKTGSCNWEGWRAYVVNVSNFDLQGGSGDGKRWVCAEFADAAGNVAGPIRDVVTFDNPPVVHNDLYFNYSKVTLTGKTSFTLDFFNPSDALHIATDADGLGSLSVIHFWQIKSNGTTVNYDSALNSTGTKATFVIDSSYCNAGSDTFTFGFTVRDNPYGIKRSGTLFIYVCY